MLNIKIYITNLVKNINNIIGCKFCNYCNFSALICKLGSSFLYYYLLETSKQRP